MTKEYTFKIMFQNAFKTKQKISVDAYNIG